MPYLKSSVEYKIFFLIFVYYLEGNYTKNNRKLNEIERSRSQNQMSYRNIVFARFIYIWEVICASFMFYEESPITDEEVNEPRDLDEPMVEFRPYKGTGHIRCISYAPEPEGISITD